MSGLTYLITSANRGISRGLLETFILRPNTTIIAAVRDVFSSTTSLSSVPFGNNSKLIIVKIDSTIDSDPAAAASELTSKHGITHIDVLISNAGLLDIIAAVLETPVSQVRAHLELNTIGPIVLLQAFHNLLSSSPEPKFLVITSSIGSIRDMERFTVPFFAYGLSKAAANYFVRKVAFEDTKFVSQAFNPGWVQTDMGSDAAKTLGMEDAPMKLEDSIKRLVKLFDGTSLEETGTFKAISGRLFLGRAWT